MQNSNLSEIEVSKAIKRNIIAGCFGYVFITATITGGIFLTGFALRLGANSFQIGLLSAFPLFAQIMQLFSSYYIEQSGQRKEIWFKLEFIRRLLWIFIVIVPFIIARSNSFAHANSLWSQVGIFALLGVTLFSSLISSFAIPIWLSWLSDIIPSEKLGKFWGNRTAILSSVALISSLIFARVIDLFPKENNLHGFLGFTIIFGIAILFGELDLLIYRSIPEPQMQRSAKKTEFFNLIKEPFGHHNFRKYLIFVIIWVFAGSLITPFVMVYFIEHLKINYFTISFLVSIQTITGIVFSGIWGYLADKFGYKSILNIYIVGIIWTPLVYLFVTQENYLFILVPFFLLTGIANSAWVIATTGFVLGLSPREHKSIFIAVFHATVGLIAGLAPIIAGAILQFTKSFHYMFFGNELVNLHILFMLCTFIWLISLFFYRKIIEAKEQSIVFVIKHLVEGNPFKLLSEVFPLVIILKIEKETMKAVKNLMK
ncbi:MAG: MFS transporter [Candidatus Firestonebacteria bacterium]